LATTLTSAATPTSPRRPLRSNIVVADLLGILAVVDIAFSILDIAEQPALGNPPAAPTCGWKDRNVLAKF
jgi:hypothetical protein